MLVLDSIDPGKFYSVKETAAILGRSDDTVIRLNNRGHLRALVLPGRSDKRHRIYLCRSFQGAEIIRFIRNHTNPN